MHQSISIDANQGRGAITEEEKIMKERKKFTKTLMLVSLLLFVSTNLLAFRGHGEGNGGDHVRATFIKAGEVVLNYLVASEQGLQLLIDHKLDLEGLRQTLSIDVITTESGPIWDNGGALVDAIGAPGKIILDRDRWFEHFEKDRDIYYLVFHEMLRAAAINDDNYVISQYLNPLQVGFKIVTHIGDKFLLIDDELLASVINSEEIAINGTGCPQGHAGSAAIFADFDYERNILDIYPKNYMLKNGISGSSTILRKSCSLAIPIKVPANTRLVISQIDIGQKFDLATEGEFSNLKLEAFTAGAHAPTMSKRVVATNDGLQGRSLLRRNEVLVSKCGAQDILRINTSFMLGVLDEESSSWASVDRITLYLKLESCPIKR